MGAETKSSRQLLTGTVPHTPPCLRAEYCPSHPPLTHNPHLIGCRNRVLMASLHVSPHLWRVSRSDRAAVSPSSPSSSSGPPPRSCRVQVHQAAPRASMWSSISGITGKLSNVAATAVQLTRDALEEDNDPMGGSKVGEEGDDLEADLAAYKKLVVDLQLQQVEVSREYQAAFAEKEVRVACLCASVPFPVCMRDMCS